MEAPLSGTLLNEPLPSYESLLKLVQATPALLEVTEPRLNRYIPHYPHEKQAAFLLLECLEAFYGGAAGGGKSDALLMAALQYVDVPGYAALLLRKSYQDLSLPDALMARAREWLEGTDAVWDRETHTWRFPSGATLTFGYLETEDDKYRYQSSAFQFIGFDELSQFTLTQYLYLFSRLRKKDGVVVPLRMRSASNPGGRGHEWVRDRFIIGRGVDDRIFISAKLEDNPTLDIASYEISLAVLDPVTRAQLRHGDWEVRQSGGMFKRESFKYIRREMLPGGLSKVRYWDQAATEKSQKNSDPDWTVGLLMGLQVEKLKEGEGKPTRSVRKYYIIDVARLRGSPAQVDEAMKACAAMDGKDTFVYIEQEPGASGKRAIAYFIDLLRGNTVRGDPKTTNKITNAGPYSSAVERGDVWIVEAAWNAVFILEHEAFPNPNIHDDQVDGGAGGYNTVGKSSGLLEWYREEAERVKAMKEGTSASPS